MADIRANPFNYYLYQDCADELGEIGDDDAALSVRFSSVLLSSVLATQGCHFSAFQRSRGLETRIWDRRELKNRIEKCN